MDKRKKFVRIVCATMAALMLLSIAVPLMLGYAEETPKEKMERLQKEIDANKASIEKTKGDKSKAEQTKQYYLSLANALKAQLAAIKENISLTLADIEVKNGEIADKAESVAAEKALFEQRMKGMYEMSRQSNLALLLGIDNLSQMQRFTENLQQITQRDTQLVEHLRAEEAVLESQRAELDGQLAELSNLEQQATDTLVEYSNAIQQADIDIASAQQSIDELNQENAELEEERKAAAKEWADWVRAQQVDIEFDGEFLWPIPGYYKLSSDFGTKRTINGVTDVHRGMDIPAPAGTKIFAAADGVVSTKNHSSYGISVKLSHGNGVATIYGHMSKRVVSDGQAVVKGELIGYVGSTGRSTGNHLHFEVNVDGNPVSAWPYLKKSS